VGAPLLDGTDGTGGGGGRRAAGIRGILCRRRVRIEGKRGRRKRERRRRHRERAASPLSRAPRPRLCERFSKLRQPAASEEAA